MRIISIDKLRPGDILGKAVYDDKCQLLLSRNIALTQNYIDRLTASNIHCVYIEDELSDGLGFENIVSDELKVQSIRAIQTVFNESTKKKDVSLNQKAVADISDLIDEIMSVIYDNRDTLYVMTELMGTDMYTYNHSAEIAILSMLVAKSVGLNQNFIKKIGVGAMLHDIGKMKIPAEVLNKVDPLTDEELNLIRQHASLGYEILKDSDTISPISRQIILLHHEKLNGSGYPFGMSQDEIPVHVRIVTLCDVFNALISNRAYREKLSVDEALEIIRAEAIYELDREIYYHLIKVINIYPQGTIVRLSNDELAIVIKENKETQTRPTVQIIRNREKAEVINLMEELTLFISKTIEL